MHTVLCILTFLGLCNIEDGCEVAGAGSLMESTLAVTTLGCWVGAAAPGGPVCDIGTGGRWGRGKRACCCMGTAWRGGTGPPAC